LRKVFVIAVVSPFNILDQFRIRGFGRDVQRDVFRSFGLV
jgi:hypothetical protein